MRLTDSELNRAIKNDLHDCANIMRTHLYASRVARLDDLSRVLTELSVRVHAARLRADMPVVAEAA